MFQIRLLNKISPSGLAILDQRDFACNEEMAHPDAVVVRSASMHDMEIPDTVRAIARAGAGVNNIPLEKCSQQGIVVFNTPGANANAVKELAIAGLLLSARKIFPAMQWAQTLKDKGDEVPALVEKGKNKFTGPELAGKKLGVIGLGAIGVQVCNTARHFNMEVYGYDPFLSVDTALKLSRAIHHVTNLQEIFQNCDFITLHLPLTPDTRGMINSACIGSMKHGVRLINFSRGELVDDDDMLAALEEKQIYCYITDFPNAKLLGNNGVIALPHLGASTPESEVNCAEMAARQLKDFLLTGNVRNSVNLPDVYVPYDRDRTRITIVHKNIPNMITQISGAPSGSNIHHLTNNSKGAYAYTIMDLDGGVIPEIVEKLKAIDGVIRVTVIEKR